MIWVSIALFFESTTLRWFGVKILFIILILKKNPSIEIYMWAKN